MQLIAYKPAMLSVGALLSATLPLCRLGLPSSALIDHSTHLHCESPVTSHDWTGATVSKDIQQVNVEAPGCPACTCECPACTYNSTSGQPHKFDFRISTPLVDSLAHSVCSAVGVLGWICSCCQFFVRRAFSTSNTCRSCARSTAVKAGDDFLGLEANGRKHYSVDASSTSSDEEPSASHYLQRSCDLCKAAEQKNASYLNAKQVGSFHHDKVGLTKEHTQATGRLDDTYPLGCAVCNEQWNVVYWSQTKQAFSVKCRGARRHTYDFFEGQWMPEAKRQWMIREAKFASNVDDDSDD